MNFTKILEYQKKDGELFTIERELNQNQGKKVSQEMFALIKKAKEKSKALEIKAGEIVKDYECIKKAYDENVAQLEKFVSKNLEEVSDKDLDTIINATSSITNNLNILEKRLFAEAESLNSTLNEFNSTKKTYGNARAKFEENKKIYEDELNIKNPQIEQIKKDLVELEKGIEPKMLSKYKQLRADRLYPVYVRLMDKSCGGCRMERSAAELDKLKAQGYLECENCHRIIIIE
ncbi:MAG: hypothetical protein PHS54_02010 [Clostridia bacterium]|nr:hypothetical protein [Clostridia bacterium]